MGGLIIIRDMPRVWQVAGFGVRACGPECRSLDDGLNGCALFAFAVARVDDGQDCVDFGI